MTVSLETLGLAVIDTEEYMVEERKNSGVVGLARDYGAIPLTGISVGAVNDVEAFAVVEGGTKTASGTVSRTVLRPGKLVSTVVLTKEARQSAGSLENAIWTELTTSQGKGFDELVAGTKAKPVGWGDSFKALSELTNEVEIGVGEDAGVDFDALEDAVKNNEITGILISSSMLSYLKRQRVGATGQRVFDITADEINGIKYSKISSNEQFLYAGNFNRAYFSWTPFIQENGTGFLLHTAGNVPDSDGVDHNLTAQNKVAIMKEDMIAFTYDDAYFVRAVPAAVEVEGE